MNKTCKFEKCHVDMQFLNPGPWLYNFTIDVMRDLKKDLKPRSIIRIMNGFLNLQKPKIPISYIPKTVIRRVITGRRKLMKYTNLEEICIAEYPEIQDSTELEKKIRGNAKYIVKRLTNEEFRRGPLFESILITARGLYEDVDSFVIRMDEIIRLRRIEELKHIEIGSDNIDSSKEIQENSTDSVNELVRTVNHINYIHNEVISDQDNPLEMEYSNQLGNITNHRNSLHNQISKVKTNNTTSVRSTSLELRLSPINEEFTTPENIFELLAQVYNNCKTYEDFVQSTNIRELAAERLIYLNNQQMKNQLVNIIIQNTWKQLQTYKIYDNYVQTLPNHLEFLNVQNSMIRYEKMNKTILPFSYLALPALQIIFPNLYTFIKYTNVVQLLKQNNVLDIKDVIQTWYNDLLNDSQTLNQKYSQLMINVRYLFVIHYEQTLSNYNDEMLEEEIHHQLNEQSFHSNVQPAFPEGIPSTSCDMPNKQLVHEKHLHNLLDKSSMNIKSLESIHKTPNIESVPTAVMDTDFYEEQIENVRIEEALPKSISNINMTDLNLVENVKDSNLNVIEAPSITSTLVPDLVALGYDVLNKSLISEELPKDTSTLINVSKDNSIQKSKQNHNNNRNVIILRDKSLSPIYITETEVSLKPECTQSQPFDIVQENLPSTQNTWKSQQSFIDQPNVQQTQSFNEFQRNINDTLEQQNESILGTTVSQITEHTSEVPTSESITNSCCENVEKLLFNCIKELNREKDIFSTSCIKEKIIEKLDKVMSAINRSQKLSDSDILLESNSHVISHDSVATEINPNTIEQMQYYATQLNLETELTIKTESPCSPYGDDVEIIPNVTEIIQVEDSMTVSQLLASQDDEVENNNKQARNEYYDLLKELKLNNSTNIDDGLLQRIDDVLDESIQVLSGACIPSVSPNLELSYNDLKQQTNVTDGKRGRRKRKADAGILENGVIGGRKMKPVDLRASSHITIQNQHITTASQLLNSQMSLFLDSQLSSLKQISTNQQNTPLSSSSKKNDKNKRETLHRKLSPNKSPNNPLTKYNLTKRQVKLLDYNITIKSLHYFKLINVKFLKKFYIKNRNKYVFSQNIQGNEDRISALLYAKHDRFVIRNQHLYKILNLNKTQMSALKKLLNIYDAYEFKLNANYNSDVILLILHLYFRSLPTISKNAIILNVHSKIAENLYDRTDYLKYKCGINNFLKNKINELYHNVV